MLNKGRKIMYFTLAVILILLPMQSAFAISGPIELIAIAVPLLKPFELLLLVLLFFKKKFKKALISLLAIALIFSFVEPKTRGYIWSQMIDGPGKLEEMKSLLKYPISSTERMSPLSDIEVNLEEGEKVYVYLKDQDTYVDLASQEVIHSLNLGPEVKKAIVLDTNPARSMSSAFDFMEGTPGASVRYSVFNLSTSQIKLEDNSIVYEGGIYKERGLLIRIIILVLMISIIVFTTRFFTILQAIKKNKLGHWSVTAHKLFGLALNIGLFALLDQLNLLPGSGERIDFSIILASALLLGKGIVLWSNWITYFSILASGYLFAQTAGDRSLSEILKALRGTKTYFTRETKLYSFGVAVFSLFLFCYFRVEHKYGIFVSLAVLIFIINDQIMKKAALYIHSQKELLQNLILKILGIKESDHKSEVFLKTFFEEQFAKFSIKGKSVSIEERDTENDSYIDLAWAYVYWTGEHAAFALSGKKLFFKENLTSSKNQIHKDFLTEIHPSWRLDLDLYPDFFEQSVHNVTPFSSDLIKFRWNEDGCDFLGSKEVLGTSYYVYDANPVIKIGNELIYCRNKERALLGTSKFMAFFKRIYLKEYLNQFIKDLESKKLPLFHMQMKGDIAALRLELASAKESSHLKKLLLKGIELTSKRPQVLYSVFNIALESWEKKEVSSPVFERFMTPGQYYGETEDLRAMEYELFSLHQNQESKKGSYYKPDIIKTDFQNLFLHAQEVLNLILIELDKTYDLNQRIWFLKVDEILRLNNKNLNFYKALTQERFDLWELHSNKVKFADVYLKKEDTLNSSIEAFELSSKVNFITYGHAEKSLEGLLASKGNTILALENILPRDVQKAKLTNAIIINKGTMFSHSSIVARSLELPMAIRNKKKIETGDFIVFDREGEIFWVEDSKINAISTKAKRCSEFPSLFKGAHFPYSIVLGWDVLKDPQFSAIAKNLLKSFPASTKKIIVRSSALKEDRNAAEAGFNKTIVCSFNENEIVEAIREVLSVENYEGDILVQEFIDVDCAGVMMTSIEKGVIGVEAAKGSHDAITSGLKSDSSLTLDREGNILSSEGLSLLSKDLCISLSHLAVMFEEHYKCPQDIEWGVVGKRVVIFQSRDI